MSETKVAFMKYKIDYMKENIVLDMYNKRIKRKNNFW